MPSFQCRMNPWELEAQEDFFLFKWIFVWMYVYVLYIFHSEILHSDQVFRDLLVTGSVLNWLESFVQTQFFSLQLSIFPFQLHSVFEHTFSHIPLTSLLSKLAKERKSSAQRLCEWRMQKMFKSIMEGIGGTQKSGHIEKGACAMWKNESALAAHRQIGRMLHNHHQDEYKTGMKGSYEAFSFRQEENFWPLIQHTRIRKYSIEICSFFGDLRWMTSHCVTSLIPMASIWLCFSFLFLLFSHIDSFFHSLLCYAFSNFFVHQKIFQLCWCIRAFPSTSKCIINFYTAKLSTCVGADRWSLNSFLCFWHIFFSSSDYVITFGSVFTFFQWHKSRYTEGNCVIEIWIRIRL